MVRTPIQTDRPSCYACYRGDADCSSCESQEDCKNLQKYFSDQKTVEELAASVEIAEPKSISLSELMTFFAQEMCRVGAGKKLSPNFRQSSRWKGTFKKIIDACAVSDIDPRLYVRAQVDTMGKWAMKAKRPFYDNMLLGKNAQIRFEEWIERNGKKNADHHYLESAEKDSKAIDSSGELHFLDLFINVGLDSRKASKSTKRVYPKWSLRQGRADRSIRVRALRDFLSQINPTLPRRIVLSGDNWKWGTVRKEIYALMS